MKNVQYCNHRYNNVKVKKPDGYYFERTCKKCGIKTLAKIVGGLFPIKKASH